jgi:deazaflavin-dependent oxidoreductase (nitroreductase family)
MSETVDLTIDQLGVLTAEVTSEAGPGAHTKRFNETLIAAFRANKGVVPGELSEIPLLLMTCTGVKTGRSLTFPLGAWRVGERLVVIASKGGAPTNPQWFHNIVANPDVVVELDEETYDATAVVTQGADRDALWAGVVAIMPVFAEYQQKTARILPVVEIVRR